MGVTSKLLVTAGLGLAAMQPDQELSGRWAGRGCNQKQPPPEPVWLPAQQLCRSVSANSFVSAAWAPMLVLHVTAQTNWTHISRIENPFIQRIATGGEQVGKWRVVYICFDQSFALFRQLIFSLKYPVSSVFQWPQVLPFQSPMDPTGTTVEGPCG